MINKPPKSTTSVRLSAQEMAAIKKEFGSLTALVRAVLALVRIAPEKILDLKKESKNY